MPILKSLALYIYFVSSESVYTRTGELVRLRTPILIQMTRSCSMRISHKNNHNRKIVHESQKLPFRRPSPSDAFNVHQLLTYYAALHSSAFSRYGMGHSLLAWLNEWIINQTMTYLSRTQRFIVCNVCRCVAHKFGSTPRKEQQEKPSTWARMWANMYLRWILWFALRDINRLLAYQRLHVLLIISQSKTPKYEMLDGRFNHHEAIILYKINVPWTGWTGL